MLGQIIRILGYPIILLWRASGWRVEGDLPDLDKYVFIYAPHTSNWDYVHMIPLALYFQRKPSTMVKDSITRVPVLGWFIKAIGGIPIDRSKSNNIVSQLAQRLQDADRMILVLAPEGTRKKTNYWKTGFYHIAVEANVPIVMGYLDYANKCAGSGMILYPKGDIDTDFAKIRAYYEQNSAARYPEKMSEIRIPPINTKSNEVATQ